MKPIIEVEHVTKEFRLGQLTSLTQGFRNQFNRALGRPINERVPFKALDDVTFAVAPGEVLGIIGHNGAGKSTILKILAGISQPTRGRVAVHGRVAPLIEVGAGLVADMTGRENIFLNASILGMKREEIKRKFDEIVAFSELEDFIDTPVKRYSSGMQVRLGFSIATSVESKILIVDEVLAVGDLAFQRKCFDRMEDLIRREQRTVLLVSHNVRQVERICSRVVLLSRGAVIEDGASAAVCRKYFEATDTQIARHHANPIADANSNEYFSGDIELESLDIRELSGGRENLVVHHADLIIRAKFLVKRPLALPRFGFGFHTSDFLYLATHHSHLSVPIANMGIGEHTVECIVRSFPLAPGNYGLRIGVSVGDTVRTIFYAENVGNLRVEDSDDYVRAWQEGLITLDTEWSLGTLPRPIDQISVAVLD